MEQIKTSRGKAWTLGPLAWGAVVGAFLRFVLPSFTAVLTFLIVAFSLSHSRMANAAPTFQWPLAPFTSIPKITQDYACRGTTNLINGSIDDVCVKSDKFHTGFDMAPVSSDVNVYAAASGTIVRIQTNDGTTDHGLGNAVVIDHGGNVYSLYAHLSVIQPGLMVGNPVTAGTTIIGVMGGSGYGQSNYYHTHLHFEIKNHSGLGDSSSAYYGYTPGYPTNYGYYDPWQYITSAAIQTTPLKIVNPSGLSVRHGPGVSYSVIANVGFAQEFVAFAKAGDWYRIYLPCSNNKSCAGWISALPTDSVVDTNATQVQVAGTGTAGLFVRSSPAGVSNLDKVFDGQSFVISGASEPGANCTKNWYPIYVPIISGAANRWVCGDYLIQAATALVNQPQWDVIGPYGGIVERLIVSHSSPSVIYIQSHNGQRHKKISDIENFRPMRIRFGPQQQSEAAINDLVVDPVDGKTLYAASYGGVLKSVNGGETWVENHVTDEGAKMAIAPSDPAIVYVASLRGGLYQSADAGATWHQMLAEWSTIFYGNPVISLSIDSHNPNILYAASSSGGAYKSIDSGQTWAQINFGIVDSSGNPYGVTALVVARSNPDILYAGTWQGVLLKSIDGGTHWAVINTGFTSSWQFAYVGQILVDHANADIVYTTISGFDGTSYVNQIFKTENGGGNWQGVNLPAAISVYASWFADPDMKSEQWLGIDQADSKIIYAATKNGVFKSSDAGQTWRDINSGLNNISVGSISLNPSNGQDLLVTSTSDFEKIIRSSDRGVTWSSMVPTVPGYTVNQVQMLVRDPIEPSVVYAATNIGLLRSNDGGSVWELIANGLPQGSGVNTIAIDPINNNILWVGNGNSLFKSETRGASWTLIQVSLGAYNGITTILIHPVDTRQIYVGTGRGVYGSADGGQTWSALNSGLPYIITWGYMYPYIYSLEADASSADVIYASTMGNGIFKSTDRGLHWFAINDGFPSIGYGDMGPSYSPVTKIIAQPTLNGGFYAATWNGMYKTRDGGQTWSEVAGFENYSIITSIALDTRSEVLYAGAANGVFRHTTAGTAMFGKIVNQQGIGLSGVNLSLTGTERGITNTNGTGNYSFNNMGAGTYTVTPSLTGYTFSPLSRNFTLTGGNAISQDFRACQTGVPLTGVLRDATTRAAVPNITITVDSAYTGSTDAAGHYSISGLACGTHTVSVNVSGFASYSNTLDTFNSWTRDISLTKNSTTQGLASLSGYSADPVNTATGNYVYQHRDMQLPGKGMPFVFERTYNSQAASDVAATSGPFGFGWTHNYNTSLTVDPSGNVTIHWGDGKTETYTNNGLGGFTPQYGVFDTLIANAGGIYTLKKKELTTYNFDAANHLASIVDKNSNTLAFTYTSGNLTQVTDTAGRNIDFAYDASNRIVSITDPILRTVQFTYDANGNLATAQDANGNITHYAYDGSHQLTILTDPRGNAVVTNFYDASNRVVTSQRDAKLGQTTYTYNTIDHKTTVVDQMGNATVDYHDTLLRLIRQDDANGNSTFYEYDAAGNRIKVTDKNGNLTTYGYDANGNVTSKTDALGNTSTIFYDANNNPLIRTDALNNTTSFIYDAVGNLTRTTDALGNTASVTYDASGLPLTVTDARGNITTSTYDPLGNPIQVTNALGNVTTFTYDAAGRKLSQRDALNHVTTYVYDNNDNPLSATDPLGQAVFSHYDGNNNRLTTIDKRGSITAFTYDVKDLLVSTTDALGGTVTTTYDALDRKIAVKDKRNNITTFAYDGVGNSIQVMDAMGNATHFTYDGNGNRLSATDPLGHTSNFTYDALNRQISATDALGNFGSTTYDALGRVTSTINAKGQITSFAYDKLGRLLQVTDANSGTVKYAYDQNGNRISMTDPNGNVTTYAYDALNRQIAKIEPLGGITAYQYDAVGNQIQVTQPNGTSIHYTYDALDRLSNVTYPDLSIVSLTYDANGNRIGMMDSLGASSYQYDPLNRVISAIDSFGKTVSYSYDANGNRISLTYPGAKIVTYGYDVLNRLFIVSDWLTHSTTYAYDAAGRLAASANTNGTTTSYGYDNANRLTSLNDATGATSIASYAYTLDAIGNHTQAIQNEPLPPVFAPGTVAYTYDADNRLNTAGSTANSFDANGNMTAKGTYIFAYDSENRMKQSTIGTTVTQYGYNGTGNRLAKSNGSSITGYVLDTNSALSKVLAETDSSGTISAYYVYGMGLISRIQSNGTTSYYHYDSRGSTVALTDMTGAVTDKYAYDAFGKLVNSQGTTANPFKYLGQYGVMDEGNGLHYVRARFYDADAGRFINKDPKNGNDQDGQSLNRYVYAQNNPVRFVDVSGFSRLEVGQALQTKQVSSDPSGFNNVCLADVNGAPQEANSWLNRGLKALATVIKSVTVPVASVSAKVVEVLTGAGHEEKYSYWVDDRLSVDGYTVTITRMYVIKDGKKIYDKMNMAEVHKGDIASHGGPSFWPW